MFCPKCGTEYPDTEKSCPACGARNQRRKFASPLDYLAFEGATRTLRQVAPKIILLVIPVVVATLGIKTFIDSLPGMIQAVRSYDDPLPALTAISFCVCLIPLLLPALSLIPLLRGLRRGRYVWREIRTARVTHLMNLLGCFTILAGTRILELGVSDVIPTAIALVFYECYGLTSFVDIVLSLLQLTLFTVYRKWFRIDGELLSRRERLELESSGRVCCKQCGAINSANETFCKECGQTLNRSHRNRDKTSRKLRRTIIRLFLIILAASVLIVLYAKGRFVQQHVDETDNYIFRETVIERFDASTSTEIPDAATVAAELEKRGFTNYVINAMYDQDGRMLETEAIDPTSTEKHPLYNVYYETLEGRLWVIYICNGKYMADPLFMYDATRVQNLLVEDEYVTSYSSNMNEFIVTIPDESELLVRRVDRIDAATLDPLDEAGVEAL